MTRPCEDSEVFVVIVSTWQFPLAPISLCSMGIRRPQSRPNRIVLALCGSHTVHHGMSPIPQILLHTYQIYLSTTDRFHWQVMSVCNMQSPCFATGLTPECWHQVFTPELDMVCLRRKGPRWHARTCNRQTCNIHFLISAQTCNKCFRGVGSSCYGDYTLKTGNMDRATGHHQDHMQGVLLQQNK